MTRVGFIGIGHMGGDQAQEIAKGPFDLMVFDVSTTATAKFAGKAKVAGSIAEIGRHAEIVGVCVRDDDQVYTVLEGKDGLIETLPKGSVVLIHSTVRPETIVALAGKAAGKGISVIDAAVTRTVLSGDGRFVYTMTGGDASVTERVRPILDTFSTDLMHVGPLGSAMALKISNNLVSWCSLLVGLQTFKLAEANGVPVEKLTAVMKRNGNLTPIMEAFLDTWRNFKGTAAERSAFFESHGKIGQKDLALAALLAEQSGAPVPIAAHARDHVIAVVSH